MDLEKALALLALRDAIYKISAALVAICDMECCDYGFEEAYKIASQYIKDYEEDKNNV